MDSGIFPYSSNGGISDIQYDWLQNNLQCNAKKNFITFSHHPLYFSEKTDYWESPHSTLAQKVLKLFSDYNVVASFAGHIHRSNISVLNGTTYYTTVSGHNDTHWVGEEPFPPSGFRTVEIAGNVIIRADITDLFSFYTGEFLYIQDKNPPV